jgi:hypothetical protein
MNPVGMQVIRADIIGEIHIIIDGVMLHQFRILDE